MILVQIIKQLDDMKKQHWSESQEKLLRENLGKKTLNEIAKELGKSELAVKLYIHRKNIVYRPSVKRNLVLELFRIKLVNPEYFAVTKDFLRAVDINQVRFWKLYRGEESPTDAEYLRLATTLKVSLQEAFEARQLSLFNDNNKIDDTSRCD